MLFTVFSGELWQPWKKERDVPSSSALPREIFSFIARDGERDAPPAIVLPRGLLRFVAEKAAYAIFLPPPYLRRDDRLCEERRLGVQIGENVFFRRTAKRISSSLVCPRRRLADGGGQEGTPS